MKRWVTIASVVIFSVLCWPLVVTAAAKEIRVADYGAVGDGVTDDGPALGRAVAGLGGGSGEAVLRFGAGRTYRVINGGGWALRLDGLKQARVEGEGATLLLAADQRALSLRGATGITVRGLRIDYEPLPFAEALVTAKDAAHHSLDVRIGDGFAVPPLGGPTHAGGEQAYFGMLWNPGPYALRGTHYMLDDLVAAPGNDARVLRAVSAGFRGFDAVQPGKTRMTVPVRGIAHRHDPGPVIAIDGSRDVVLEDIEIWSAPWFAVVLTRNEGTVTLRHVNVRPKPGTARITSSWRDGMHVKGNRARLLFEDCILDGMNDDSFNIATFISKVLAVDNERIRVRQNYPDYVPFRVGDHLGTYAVVSGAGLGGAVVRAVEEKPAPGGAAPEVLLVLDHPVANLAVGDQVWSVEAANPDTVVRRCTIRNSCRFQSPVTLEGCDVAAFLWFYGEVIEGPVPARVTVRNCQLRLGRGNWEKAVECDGVLHGPPRPGAPAVPSVMNEVLFANNDIDGTLEILHAQGVKLIGNRFQPQRAQVILRDCPGAILEGNRAGSAPLPADRVHLEGRSTRGN